MIYLRIIYILSFLIVISSCQAQEDTKYKIFTYIINNEDPNCFGYEDYEEDQDIAPRSMVLDDSIVYIIDGFHSNVKRININTGKLTSSNKLSHYNIWLRDIAFFNGKICISSDLDSIYILNSDLSYFSSINIDRNEKYFYVNNDSLFLYFPSTQYNYSINKDFKLIKYGIRKYYPYTSIHGKKYSVINKDNISIIENEFYKLTLNEKIADLSFEFDALNLDFNKSTFIYYDVTSDIFKLFVYKVE